jgi:nicotinamide-nucleotide amidase
VASFLNADQQMLVTEIAALLTGRGETVAVAEGTAGGLISAGLLAVAGASRYFVGGGVLYTLKSRIALAGVDPATLTNYQGTTPEMLAANAEGLRQRLETTWCIAESGLAGPTGGRSGAPPGRTTIGVAGPINRVEVFETGLTDRETNMVEFTTLALRFLRDAIKEAPRS